MTQSQGHDHEADTRHTNQPRRDDAGSPEREVPTPPLLALQQTAGNRVVQRLVTGGGTGSPRRIQRHVAPETSAMGTTAHAGMLEHAAEVMVETSELQTSVGSLQQLAGSLMQDSTEFLIFQVLAENYPATQPSAETSEAPPGGGTTGD